MLLAVVLEGAFHADRILVVVVDAGLLGMAAAGIEPDLRIALDRVHPSLLEGIEEHDTIERRADRPHRQARGRCGQPRLERQPEGEVLDLNRVWIAAVGEDRGGMVGVALALDDEKPSRVELVARLVRDPHLVDAVAIGITPVVGEEVDELHLVADDVAIKIARLVELVAGLVVGADGPPPADRLDAGGEILGSAGRREEERKEQEWEEEQGERGGRDRSRARVAAVRKRGASCHDGVTKAGAAEATTIELSLNGSKGGKFFEFFNGSRCGGGFRFSAKVARILRR